MTNVDRYVQSELRLLAEADVHSITRATPQRLAVFKNGWSMIAGHLTPDVGAYIERLLAEYDALLAQNERKLKESSIEHERKRIEAECAKTLERLRQEQEESITRRHAKLAKLEQDLEDRRRALDEESKEIRYENERLKRQHDDDHDRAATLSHAVIESRLATQQAEQAQLYAERQLKHLQMADAAKLDLMDDVVNLTQLLRRNGIPYELKTKYVLDIVR